MKRLIKLIAKVNKGYGKGSASHIILAIVSMFTAILPLLVAGFNHNFADPTNAENEEAAISEGSSDDSE